MTAEQRTPARVMAFMNQKGGVGKTTTTVNLAAALARKGRRTLLIDLDPQAHASIHLGYEGDADAPTVYDVLLGDEAPSPARAREHLELIPAETDLAAAESELATLQAPQHRLRKALERLDNARPESERPEFVLLDCPPSLGQLTVNALVAAREVFIPMQAHFLALQGVGKLIETVGLLRGTPQQPGLNPKLRVSGVVLCMHDKQAHHTQEVVADLDTFFEHARTDPSGADGPLRFARVYRPPIRRNIKLAECPSFGQTIFDYAPDANGAEDYTALADNILSEFEGLPNASASTQLAAGEGTPDQPKVAVVGQAARDSVDAHAPTAHSAAPHQDADASAGTSQDSHPTSQPAPPPVAESHANGAVDAHRTV
ncbi:MAG: AAA family ATPase [Planctomycetota bacterium]